VQENPKRKGNRGQGFEVKPAGERKGGNCRGCGACESSGGWAGGCLKKSKRKRRGRLYQRVALRGGEVGGLPKKKEDWAQKRGAAWGRPEKGWKPEEKRSNSKAKKKSNTVLAKNCKGPGLIGAKQKVGGMWGGGSVHSRKKGAEKKNRVNLHNKKKRGANELETNDHQKFKGPVARAGGSPNFRETAVGEKVSRSTMARKDNCAG